MSVTFKGSGSLCQNPLCHHIPLCLMVLATMNVSELMAGLNRGFSRCHLRCQFADSEVSLSGSWRTSSCKASIKEFHQFAMLTVTIPLEVATRNPDFPTTLIPTNPQPLSRSQWRDLVRYLNCAISKEPVRLVEDNVRDPQSVMTCGLLSLSYL